MNLFISTLKQWVTSPVISRWVKNICVLSVRVTVSLFETPCKVSGLPSGRGWLCLSLGISGPILTFEEMLVLSAWIPYCIEVFLLAFILQIFFPLTLKKSIFIFTSIIALVLHLGHVLFGLINKKSIWVTVVSAAVFGLGKIMVLKGNFQ